MFFLGNKWHELIKNMWIILICFDTVFHFSYVKTETSGLKLKFNIDMF